MKQGIYCVEYEATQEIWTIDPKCEGYATKLGEVQVSEPYWLIFLPAIDPVSAFTRGCNLIRDKVEGV